MNISEDDTKELDSYGVWVKNTTSDENQNDDFNLDDSSLDLPDFDDTDFSDMFKDDSQFSTAETSLDDFSNDLDSTLSTDELANITSAGDVSIENVESPIIDDDFNIAVDSIENPLENTEITIEQPIIEDNTIEDNAITEDDITFDESAITEENISEEIATDSEEVSFDDEEISLDDFMDGGFSDDSVAAGNNGFEAGYEPGGENNPIVSDSTEELSLDDFMDEGFTEVASDSPKQDTIEDEPPLEMDISFDDSASTVQTEDNISLDVDDDEDETIEVENSIATEDVSLDSFGDDFATSEIPVSESNIDTEEVDLSDFGIDASAEETPITQDVEEAKNHETVVDYDLNVGDENTATAPIVSEISTSEEQTEDDLEVISPTEPVAPSQTLAPNTTAVDNSLLQQIVADLSGLKDEINRLKSNIEEIKTAEHTIASSTVPNVSEEIIIDENPIIEENSNDSDGGFFGDSDEDDTLALSFDELDNIMNTADFSPTEITADDENDVVADEEIAIDTENEISIDVENAVSEDEVAIEENHPVEIEDEITEEDSQDLTFNYDDENLSEPVIDDIVLDGQDEENSDELDLPSEISIPTDDEMIVDSTTSDFMDSVSETTEENKFPDVDSLAEEANLPSEIEDSVTEETISDENDEIVENDTVIEETIVENDEPTFEETSISEDIETSDTFADTDDFINEENTINEEDTINEETDDTLATETYIEDSFAEVDNIDNTLSSSNLDYLETKETEESIEPEVTMNDSVNTNVDLKQDIKSVLLYMDQLLENLPEEKIIEFAKSDEFTTYKKLFSELGLS